MVDALGVVADALDLRGYDVGVMQEAVAKSFSGKKGSGQRRPVSGRRRR